MRVKKESASSANGRRSHESKFWKRQSDKFDERDNEYKRDFFRLFQVVSIDRSDVGHRNGAYRESCELFAQLYESCDIRRIVGDLFHVCERNATDQGPKERMWWKKIMQKVASDCLNRGFSTYLCTTVPEDRASRGLNAFFRRHGAREGNEGICFIGEWEKIA